MSKEVLDYRLFPQEAAENDQEMLEDSQQKGCHEVLLFITDGLTGLKEVCTKVYPKALHQACWVHLQRNVARLVRAKDRKEILEQLKPVYQASTPLEAEETLSEFLCSIQS